MSGTDLDPAAVGGQRYGRRPSARLEEAKMINLVVLHGTLARPASQLELPSGTRMVTFEVTVRRPEGPAEAVPVTWTDPPSWASVADTGTEVMVLGRVRRRFFRSAGITQSRTEVVAAKVVRASSRRRVAAVLAEAVGCLEKLS